MNSEIEGAALEPPVNDSIFVTSPRSLSSNWNALEDCVAFGYCSDPHGVLKSLASVVAR